MVKFVSWNVRGLHAKLSSKIDLICDYEAVLLQETFISDDVNIPNFPAHYYVLSSRAVLNRSGTGRPASGLLTLLNSSYFRNVKKIDELSNSSFLVVKALFVGRAIVIANVYRAPASSPAFVNDFLASLRDVFEYCRNENCPLIVGGDFNSRIGDHLGWEHILHHDDIFYEFLPYRSRDNKITAQGVELVHFMADLNVRPYYPMVNNVAQSTFVGGEAMLEFFLTSRDFVMSVSGCQIIIHVLSDHYPVVEIEDSIRNHNSEFPNHGTPVIRHKLSLARIHEVDFPPDFVKVCANPDHYNSFDKLRVIDETVLQLSGGKRDLSKIGICQLKKRERMLLREDDFEFPSNSVFCRLHHAFLRLQLFSWATYTHTCRYTV